MSEEDIRIVSFQYKHCLDMLCMSYELFLEDRLGEFGFVHSFATIAAKQELVMSGKDPSWVVLVAEINGKAVGGLVSRAQPSTFNNSLYHAHVQAWYTRPDYRGKGIGYMLLDEMERQWIKKGVNSFILSTSAHNTKLTEQHMKHGYVPVETLHFKIVPNDGGN